MEAQTPERQPFTMLTPKTILLLFEDEQVPLERLVYSLELAHRMGCELGVLMLVDETRSPEAAAIRARLEARILELAPPGARINIELCIGDKAAELVAFVTRTPSVVTLVWGGDEEVLGGRDDRLAEHWLTRVRSELSCPIVISTPRRLGGELGNRERQSREEPCS